MSLTFLRPSRSLQSWSRFGAVAVVAVVVATGLLLMLLLSLLLSSSCVDECQGLSRVGAELVSQRVDQDIEAGEDKGLW